MKKSKSASGKRLKLFDRGQPRKRDSSARATAEVFASFDGIQLFYMSTANSKENASAEQAKPCAAKCKIDIAAKLNKFLTEHRESREKAKDVIDKYHITLE